MTRLLKTVPANQNDGQDHRTLFELFPDLIPKLKSFRLGGRPVFGGDGRVIMGKVEEDEATPPVGMRATVSGAPIPVVLPRAPLRLVP